MLKRTIDINSPEFEKAVLKIIQKIKPIINDIEDPRFERLADGWIKDNALDLEWGPSSSESMIYSKAEEYCKILGGRLPTVDELQTLIDRTVYNPATNKQAFKDVKSEYYWTSTKYVAYDKYRWVVGFYNGNVDCHGEGNLGYVRPVRVSQC